MTVVFIDGDPPGCECGPRCEMPCWQRVGLTDQPCCAGCAPLPCACTGDRHARGCAYWTSRTCECDPLGEGLDHHRWCGQHPTHAFEQKDRPA